MALNQNQFDGGVSPIKPSRGKNFTDSRDTRSFNVSMKQSPVPSYTSSQPFTPTPTPPPQVDGGGGGGGGGYYGGGGGGVAAPPSDEDYAANDQILIAALGALDRAMKDYEAQYKVDVDTYDRDYNRGLGDLGFRDLDPTEAQNMGWDWNDVLTASGRAFKNTNEDFANRGMLQSSGYADALQLLERSLNDQKVGMDTARGDFMGDIGRRRSEFKNQDTLARQQARAESAARKASEYGIV